jgi:CRP/FNR family cyclic AMP-dependent transcriptional regulator
LQTIDLLLRDIPAFRRLTDEMLEVVAGCGTNVHFDPETLLFREGEAADIFFVVRQGTVALETFAPPRGAMLIDTVDDGDLVGWSWLFAPYRWHFDARTVTDVRATAFDGVCLRGKCDADPELGYAVMSCFARVMMERLQSTRLRLLDVYGNGRTS